MGKPLSASCLGDADAATASGVVLLLAQLALRRVQSPSRLEETIDHGRDLLPRRAGLTPEKITRQHQATTGDHLHPPVDASAG